MGLLPSVPQTITQNIYDTVKVWCKSFFVTLPLMIIMCSAVTITSFYTTYAQTAPHTNIVLSNKLLCVLCACFILIIYILYAAIFHRINSVIYNKNDSLFISIYIGIKKFIFLLIASIITIIALALIVLVIALPFLLLFHLAASNLPNIWPFHQPILQQRVQLFALVTIVFAYVYAAVLLLFYFPLIIIDNLNPVSAFTKSCYLVWGNWWRTAIIIGMMYFILPLFLYIIQWYFAYHLAAPYISYLHQWMISSFLQSLISIFYVPLFVSGVLVVMHDLKIRKYRTI